MHVVDFSRQNSARAVTCGYYCLFGSAVRAKFGAREARALSSFGKKPCIFFYLSASKLGAREARALSIFGKNPARGRVGSEGFGASADPSVVKCRVQNRWVFDGSRGDN